MKNMDRTSWIGVLACLGLLFAWGFWNTKEAAKRAEEQRTLAAEAAETAAAEEANQPAPEEATTPETTAETTAPATTDAPDSKVVEESTHVLENELVRFTFTNKGGGLSTAELKSYPKDVGIEDLVTVNAVGKAAVGTLSTGHDSFDTSNWTVTSSSDTSISYETRTRLTPFRAKAKTPIVSSSPSRSETQLIHRSPWRTATSTPEPPLLFTSTNGPCRSACSGWRPTATTNTRPSITTVAARSWVSLEKARSPRINSSSSLSSGPGSTISFSPRS